jgi:lysophospholipase L1-like esterase
MAWGTNVAALMGAGTSERFVATRARPLSSVALSNKQIMSRTAHVASADITALKIAIANFRMLDSSSTETGLGGSTTCTASVEFPAGTYKQITFDAGSASTVIPDTTLIITDMTTGNLGIPAGATFWILMYKTSATGVLYNSWRNTAMGDLTWTAASGVADRTMGGVITSSGNYSVPPMAIIAMTSAKAILGIGDSKTAGFGDSNESATAAGPGQLGEIASSIPTDQPFVNIATGGMRADLWPTLATQRKKLLPYASHYFFNLGFNDIYNNAASAATCRTNVELILAEILAANPGARITLGTQSHKSTSTDSWATTGNQTTVGQTAQRNIYNGYVRAGSIAGNNNGYFEISDQLETVRDNGIWKVTGAAFGYTGDGTHESPAGYDLISASGAVDVAVKLAS